MPVVNKWNELRSAQACKAGVFPDKNMARIVREPSDAASQLLVLPIARISQS